MPLIVKILDGETTIFQKEIELPYDFTDQSTGTIKYHLRKCVYCGSHFISGQKQTKHCSNKCLVYTKRLKQKIRREKEKTELKKIREKEFKDLRKNMDFLKAQRKRWKK